MYPPEFQFMPTRRRESRCGSDHHTPTKPPSLAEYSAVHSCLRTGLRAPVLKRSPNAQQQALGLR